MSLTIYGIKNCDTMKKARAWLDKAGKPYAFHDYKTAGIDRARLEGWAKKVGWEALLNRAGHDLPQAAGRRQGGPDREEGAGPDAGAALDDPPAGPGGTRRKIARGLQAGKL